MNLVVIKAYLSLKDNQAVVILTRNDEVIEYINSSAPVTIGDVEVMKEALTQLATLPIQDYITINLGDTYTTIDDKLHTLTKPIHTAGE